MHKTDKSLWYTQYYEYQREYQLERLERLEELLPHGSGVNGNWHFKYSSHNRILASNCYSAMNESGMYCHDYDFTARIQYNGKDKSKPCDICMNEYNAIPGYRSYDDLARYGWTLEEFIKQSTDILYNGRYWKCLRCDNGIIKIPEYEFISLNFHGQREYSCCGYELKNYMSDHIAECLSYSQEKG